VQAINASSLLCESLSRPGLPLSSAFLSSHLINPGSLKYRPVVILAERDKEEMDRQLRKALRGTSLEWHTRSGAPHAAADLEKVAAGQARTVILLQPDAPQVRGCLIRLSMTVIASLRRLPDQAPRDSLKKETSTGGFNTIAAVQLLLYQAYSDVLKQPGAERVRTCLDGVPLMIKPALHLHLFRPCHTM
jgi:hypothetical protein